MSNEDPFEEHSPHRFRRRLHLLGGVFEFECNDRRLLRLVDIAYSGLPRHSLPKAGANFRVRLHLQRGRSTPWREPPELRTQGGAGLLCGIVDAANFAIVSPETRAALLSFSRELLRFPYHARYELLEFAVFTLASRAQGLAPLHAGCVGSNDRGVLLIGESGAGKSTLSLHCMLQGLDFLAEDAVFVAPDTLSATGIANFLHLREDALRFIDRASVTARIRNSPVIRRRSGVEKFEVDLRHPTYRLARAPLKLIGLVLISKKPAKGSDVLIPLNPSRALEKFTTSQPYAAHLPSWIPLAKKLSRIGAFELRRGRHPEQAATALRGLICQQ